MMQAPLKQYLRVDDEPALRRGWREIEARLDGPPVRSRRPLVLGLGFAFAATAVVMVVLLRGGAPTQAPGALALSSGGAMPSVVSTPVALADGSSIDVTGGQLEILENDADTVHLVLPRGRARFAITPGGPRTWTIDTGIAEVRVVGTELAVDREPHAVTVSVTRGIVEVRSPHLASYRRLVAGEQLRVTEDVPIPPRTASIAAPSAAVASAPSTLAPATTARPSSTLASTPVTGAGSALPDRTTRAPAAGSPAKQSASTASTETSPAAELPTTAKALLVRADEQRRAGDIDAAIETLARTATMPGDDSTGLAWFTRAKLLAQQARPAEAIADFERALAAGLPPALAARAQERIDELRTGTP